MSSTVSSTDVGAGFSRPDPDTDLGREQPAQPVAPDVSVFQSPAIRDTLAQIARASETRDSLIVCGEPGTGRERAARAINDGFTQVDRRGAIVEAGFPGPSPVEGGRPDRSAPFFVIDCSTPDVRALEALLFGTIARPAGDDGRDLDVLGGTSRMVMAAGGTIALRNVVEMPPRLQLRLAHLLRDREATLADAASTRIDVDVRIAALLEPGYEQQIEEGRLLPELARRLSGPRVDTPPLRLRREDMPGLVTRTIEAVAAAMRTPPKRVSVAAMQVLAALPWRGNLPELRGVLQLMLVKVPGPVIRLADVLATVRLDCAVSPLVVGGTLKEARERFERDYVALVLEQHKGRMAEAAKTLGIQRTNLYRKVRQLSVHRRSPTADRRP